MSKTVKIVGKKPTLSTTVLNPSKENTFNVCNSATEILTKRGSVDTLLKNTTHIPMAKPINVQTILT